MNDEFNELLASYDEYQGATLDYATDFHDYDIENKLRNSTDYPEF